MGKRLRKKTTVQRTLQVPLLRPPLEGEDAGAKKKVYLVTLSHPQRTHSQDGFQLVAPGSLLKTEVLEKFLDSCRRPLYQAANLTGSDRVMVDKVSVHRELHKETENDQAFEHDHLPVLAFNSFRFLPVKRALLQRHGLASHWSTTHTGQWSALRYLVVPSPAKPQESLDQNPVYWAGDRDGNEIAHPPPRTLCNEPLTAAALKARREHQDNKAAEDSFDFALFCVFAS